MAKQRHGMSETAEYKAWGKIKSRCFNNKRHNFSRYGGRGITICDEWRSNFKAFFEHVGPRPTSQHSLDRINNDLGYCPGNVRWATPIEQGRNRGNNRFVEHNGEARCISEWAKMHGLTHVVLRYRLMRGWAFEDAIAVPSKPGRRGGRGSYETAAGIEFNSETHSLTEWASITGINADALWHRLHNDWPIEKALSVPVRKWRRSL